MKKTKNQITNQNKGQVHQTILFSKLYYISIYRILTSALLIVNVSVESNSRKYNIINWHWPVFPLSSFFLFPSSYLSDYSDPVKMPQLSLNVNHRQCHNHYKTSTKQIRNTDAMAERLGVWCAVPRFDSTVTVLFLARRQAHSNPV